MNVDTTSSHPIKLWTGDMEVEREALDQLRNIAGLPFIFKHVAVMPDVHLGRGATVGSVIATKGAIIPAAVGVDIGCGMVAARLNLTAAQLPESLVEVRRMIERTIPVGNGPGGSHGSASPAMARVWREKLWERFATLVGPREESATTQLGTLGGGNHFIEVCLDEKQDVWVVLHSGSRGVGNRIGQFYIELAKEDMRKHFINLPDKDLAYLAEGTDFFEEYVKAVGWAQDYAHYNRQLMLSALVQAIAAALKFPVRITEENISCHHNYISKEHHFGENVWVTRKGAVRAREGDLGVIPGSMGARSFIVRGKGNPESFTSCSHGAGRRMSRTAAKKAFTVEDHIAATEGVECRKDSGVLDETPGSYKNIDEVMAAQSELVEVVHTLKQVLCVKG